MQTLHIYLLLITHNDFVSIHVEIFDFIQQHTTTTKEKSEMENSLSTKLLFE